MKSYEAVMILQPGLAAEKLTETIQKVKDILIKYGCTIQSENKWGKRPLAYSIKKRREGNYLILLFQADPLKIKPIQQAYRLLDEEVLRTLIIQRDEPQVAKVA